MKIDPTALLARSSVSAPVKAPQDKASKAIHRQAKELEGVFLRKLIEESKIGQSSSGSPGYGSMAVDALAGAISDAGGIGMTKMIEDALNKRMSSAHATSSPSVPAESPTTAPKDAASTPSDVTAKPIL